MRNKIFYHCILIFFCSLSATCHDNDESNHKNNNKLTPPATIISASRFRSSKTIAENIQADTSYNILAESLISSGVIETLTRPGPFTIFVPSNKAFRDLPDGTFESWMNDRKDDLANILSYHIVAGSINSKDVEDGKKLKTLAGDELIISKRNGRLLVNGIKILEPDIETSNGIIYVIDGVLFP
jgi:uncharacterized surface protein with fasciclin (FAS1) repeats